MDWSDVPAVVTPNNIQHWRYESRVPWKGSDASSRGETGVISCADVGLKIIPWWNTVPSRPSCELPGLLEAVVDGCRIINSRKSPSWRDGYYDYEFFQGWTGWTCSIYSKLKLIFRSWMKPTRFCGSDTSVRVQNLFENDLNPEISNNW